MRTPISRSGVRHARVGAQPPRVVDLLSDPAFVTRALGDLLDQQRSRGTEPVTWALPRLHLGTQGLEVVLRPSFAVDRRTVTITASSTPTSDADATITLRGTAVAEQDHSVLSTYWELDLVVPLPHAVVRLARPALHRAIEGSVDDITSRLASGIDGA